MGGFEPRENRVKERCTQASLNLVFQAMPVENVWPSRSKSAYSQVSAALF